MDNGNNNERDMPALYSGKTVVVKYGGAAMQSGGFKRGAMEDVAWLAAAGARVLLVHGGGPELSALQRRLGMETKFADGVRYTDAETMDAVFMALCGKVNKGLVQLIQNAGGRAAGLSGIDGGILRCVKKTKPDLGFVGEITKVDTGLLDAVLEAGYVPVISTAALGEDGFAYNVNADTAAGSIAAALRADLFITMSDIPGVLRNVGDASSLIANVRADEIEGLIAAGTISGGMIPKARGLRDAVAAGVLAAKIIDGRRPRALRDALAGKAGGGTTIAQAQPQSPPGISAATEATI
ncbi:MAG: acetylglutamate kinase [Clostridiales Family XIII bacterium]|jgi:acetylglutamate kinase|nr:acetylglutamate kinase [Clostridiales Family XIII bacterium]